MKSQGPCESFEPSIVRIGLKLAEFRVENETQIATVLRRRVRAVGLSSSQKAGLSRRRRRRRCRRGGRGQKGGAFRETGPDTGSVHGRPPRGLGQRRHEKGAIEDLKLVFARAGVDPSRGARTIENVCWKATGHVLERVGTLGSSPNRGIWKRNREFHESRTQIACPSCAWQVLAAKGRRKGPFSRGVFSLWAPKPFEGGLRHGPLGSSLLEGGDQGSLRALSLTRSKAPYISSHEVPRGSGF